MINKLKEYFKKSEKRDIYHVEIRDKVEKAFKCKGIQYYKYKGSDLLDAMCGRYMFINAHLEELNQRLTNEDLIALCEKAQLYLGGINGTINIGKVAVLVQEIQNRASILPDPKIYMRLASIVYFDETESLDGYEYAHNDKKIKDWEEEGDLGFFLREPMKSLLPQEIQSEDGFQAYFQKLTERSKATLKLMDILGQ